mmetsp:Transcript_97457/g.276165  ORF Transcript_97457/g.276165 Transcript_97457/m.276165 type:complete len:457 (-) Transcript_97457:63-1433(-)
MRVSGARLAYHAFFAVLSHLVVWADGILAASSRNASLPGSAGTRDCYSRYDGMPMLRLTTCSPGAKRRMRAAARTAGCVETGRRSDLGTPRGGCADTVAACPAVAAEMLAVAFPGHARVVLPDAGAHFRATENHLFPVASSLSSADSFFTRFQNLEDQTRRIRELVEASGGRATIEEIGRSHEGRPLHLVKFTGSGGSRKKLLANYGIHAREWITGMAGVWAVQSLLQKVEDDPSYLDGLEVHILPMVNPDGFEFSRTTDRMWRKNMSPNGLISDAMGCKGVDLNRNFDALYGRNSGSSCHTCNEEFRGPRAASEPEALAVKRAIAAANPDAHLDFHAYGMMVLKPTASVVPEGSRAALDEYGQAVKAGIEAQRPNAKHFYQMGHTEDMLYGCSGLLIDYAQDQGAMSVTIELSPNEESLYEFNLPPEMIQPVVKHAMGGVEGAISWLKKPTHLRS